MPNDIEFPQPNAIVGPAFYAGGEYELLTFRKDLVKGAKPPEGTKIQCKLFKGTAEKYASGDFPVSTTPGTWQVYFANAPTDDNPYVLKAFITIPPAPEALLDFADNITITATAAGEIVVTLFL